MKHKHKLCGSEVIEKDGKAYCPECDRVIMRGMLEIEKEPIIADNKMVFSGILEPKRS